MLSKKTARMGTRQSRWLRAADVAVWTAPGVHPAKTMAQLSRKGAAKLLTRDEARRIAVNIAKLRAGPKISKCGLRCCTWHMCGFVWQKSA
jgi:hypothetical protein